MNKARKKTSWAKAGKKAEEIARAPLIISPVAGGPVSKHMKDVCKKFAIQHNIHIQIKQRGGNKMSREVKSNPLRCGGCGREDCMAHQEERGIAVGAGLAIEFLVNNV